MKHNIALIELVLVMTLIVISGLIIMQESKPALNNIYEPVSTIAAYTKAQNNYPNDWEVADALPEHIDDYEFK